MKRFWMAVPSEYEEGALRKIGELGTVQFVREAVEEHGPRRDSAEIQTRFTRLRDRIHSLLPEVRTEELLQSAEEEPQTNLEQISLFMTEIEKELDEITKKLNAAETENGNLQKLKEHLKFLDSSGLRVDSIGNFKHIFVKAGFLNNLRLSRLNGYTAGTSIVYATKPGKDRESFVAITGSVEDEPFMETTLKLLNFQELNFPQNISPEPKKALDETEKALQRKREEIQSITSQLLRTKEKFESYEPCAFGTLQIETTKNSILRTKKNSLIEGWIPTKQGKCPKTGY